MARGVRYSRRGVGAVLVIIAAGFVLSGHRVRPHPDLAVEVLSSRPDHVTGGDALVAVALPPGTDADEVRVRVGDRSVTEDFELDAATRRMVGLVDGLPDGEAHIIASVAGGDIGVTVTGHPTGGPVFAGEQLALHACTTEWHGLEPSTPKDGCAAPRVVRWDHVDEDGTPHELVDPTRPPDDAATVEVDGHDVPFILRTETGVLNRSVYEITMVDPQPDPDAAPDMSAWNGRLVYQFGGGCDTTFTQGTIEVAHPNVDLLAQGYATATATFNTSRNLCNNALSAETASIVKERFIEAYDVPVHTIGLGASGGAIQQILLAQNHPGLLDGIVPAMPYPDLLSIAPAALDCVRLEDYYATPAGSRLDDHQRAAINGHATSETCEMWDDLFRPLVDPSACGPGDADGLGGPGREAPPTVPPAHVYDPETNPSGQRCTLWESNVAITGRDPDSGLARSSYDNQGVQYGLDALNAGAISWAEFLDLNADIGGFDADGQPASGRSVADRDAVARVYATGGVMGPWGGIPDTPMILVNTYIDPYGDIHDRVRAYSILDRLAERGEWPATVSLWTSGLDRAGASSSDTDAPGNGPVVGIDEWLTAATADHERRGGTWQDALTHAKPPTADSRCLLPGRDIIGPDANEHPACVRAFPVHEDPRMAAGGRRAGDVLKCRLRPIEASLDLYDIEPSPAEAERLASTFPDGVCDPEAGGVGYQPPMTTWPDLGGDQSPVVPTDPDD